MLSVSDYRKKHLQEEVKNRIRDFAKINYLPKLENKKFYNIAEIESPWQTKGEVTTTFTLK